MGGFFGVVSQDECVDDLFYGVDYHSHLGTVRGGMAVTNAYGSIIRSIHDISNEMFRSKFGPDLERFRGAKCGIGVISDMDDQPLLIASHLGMYSIVTVGKLNNIEELTRQAIEVDLLVTVELAHLLVVKLCLESKAVKKALCI